MKQKGPTTPRAYRKGIFLPVFKSILSGRLVCLCWLALCLLSCQEQTSHATFTSDVPQEDLFPDKAEVRHATGFTLTYHGHYKVVNILNHFEDRTDTLRYVLVQRGTPRPTHIPRAQFIEIPVRGLVGTSSTHVGLVEFAGAAEVMVGFGQVQYMYSEEMRQRMAVGNVQEVGIGGGLNEELVIAMQPDLVMVMGSPESTFGRFHTLIAAGVPVLVNTEWLETTPLGRAEWVKVMGALLNKEKLVNEKFASVEKEYLRLAALARQAQTKPTVITGMPYKGAWSVPGRDSFMTQFLEDAGADYAWAEARAKASLQLNFESVAPVALEADYWLNPGHVFSKEEIVAQDERFADFRPFQKNTIYNNTNRMSELGSNDFWESGAVNPHLILADLIKILHPALLPEHELVYHKQLL